MFHFFDSEFFSKSALRLQMPTEAEPTEPYRSARLRAIVALLLGAIWIVVTAAAVGAENQRAALVEEMRRVPLTAELVAAAESSDRLQLQMFVALFAVCVCASIAYFAWLYRAYANLPALGAKGLMLTPAMAILYFRDGKRLTVPYDGMKEILAGSDPAGLENITGFAKPRKTIVKAWIALLIADIFTLIFSIRADRIDLNNPGAAASQTSMRILHLALSIAAILLTMYFIWRADRDQAARADILENQPTALQSANRVGAPPPKPSNEPLDWSNFNFDK